MIRDPMRVIFTLTAFALLAASCAGAQKPDGDAAARARASDYAPLKVGAMWTYDMQYPGQVGEMTVRLVGEQDGFVLDDRNGALRHTSEGLRDRDRYLIKNPLVPGAKWKTIVGPSAVEHAEIVSVGEQCEAAAGKFADCLVVHGWIRRDDKVTLHIDWTWAKDVGLVKVETAADISGRGRVPQTKQSLRQFSLTGAPAAGVPIEERDEAPERWE